MVSLNNRFAKRFIAPAPSLSQTVLDQGVIISYTRLSSTSTPNPMPWSLPVSATTYVETDFRPLVGRIIYFFYIPTSNSTTTPVAFGSIAGGAAQFRYVIIPGAVGGGRMMSGPATGYSIDQLKNMPYKDLVGKFNIPSTGTNILE